MSVAWGAGRKILDMEPQPIRKYVYLGGAQKYLEDAQEGRLVHGQGLILANINNFLKYLDSLGLPVTARAAVYVGLVKMRDELAKSDAGARLTADQATKLREEMRKLRVTLLSESDGKEAFIVTGKRFDIQKLLHAPGELLAPGVFDDSMRQLAMTSKRQENALHSNDRLRPPST
jgi:hypothetical protein